MFDDDPGHRFWFIFIHFAMHTSNINVKIKNKSGLSSNILSSAKRLKALLLPRNPNKSSGTIFLKMKNEIMPCQILRLIISKYLDTGPKITYPSSTIMTHLTHLHDPGCDGANLVHEAASWLSPSGDIRIKANLFLIFRSAALKGEYLTSKKVI